MPSAFDTTRFTAAQIAELTASGISPEIAERAGLYSVDDAKSAAKLFGRLARHWEGHLPVLVYPYLIPFQRDPVLVRGKPARAFEQPRKDGSVSLVKYVQPKDTGTHIAFGPSLLDGKALRDVSIPLWITEGEKKMFSAESHGLSCIALPGVSQWHIKGQKTLHPYFAHVALREREIFLAFDADALSNDQVRKQELLFARALEAAGAKVRIVRFPQDAQKLDDFLATHELSELAALMEDARNHGAPPPDTTGPVGEEWGELFQKLRLDRESGLPVKDTDTITRVLMHHPAWVGVLRFDARRERQIFAKEPPFATDVALAKATVPRAVTDSDMTRIGDWLVTQPSLGWATQPKTQQVEHAVQVVCEQARFDGVRDYLLGLKWDGVARLDLMASTHFGAEDTAYTRAVVSKWMMSAVARARTPGCQVDHVLVLEGPQGIGKSTALRILAGSDFFSDTVPEIPSKDALEHCIGPWIIELAELDHMRKSEVTAVKAFISARAPSFRGAYARRTVEHPRRCVFAGTTNESGYLADATGNRRFWPLACTVIDLEAITRDRDQLWAEALARVRAGESWHITDPDVRAAAEEEQAARRQVDPWHDAVSQYVSGRTHTTVGDVLDQLGHGPEEPATGGWGTYRQQQRGARQTWRYDQRAANRVSAILRDLGWIRRMVRVDGYRVWRYELEGGVTSRKYSGDIPVTGQVIDFKGKSPLSPLSPLETASNRCARDASAGHDSPNSPPSSPSQKILQKDYSGDTGDSGDLEAKSDGYPVTTVSPVSAGSGDTPPDAAAGIPRRRL